LKEEEEEEEEEEGGNGDTTVGVSTRRSFLLFLWPIELLFDD